MKKLTAYNSQNDCAIGMMMGKAMCAYANWQKAEKTAFAVEWRVACRSEYEATVRCIAMFVKESIYEIQAEVIDSCKEEFGV